jgi:hypothetical protein
LTDIELPKRKTPAYIAARVDICRHPELNFTGDFYQDGVPIWCAKGIINFIKATMLLAIL